MIYDGKIILNFISQEECDFLLNYAKTNAPWQKSKNEYWSERCSYFHNLHDDDPYKIKMSDINNKIKQALIEHYRLDKIWSDTIHIAKWPEGFFADAHYDGEQDPAYGAWNYAHRKFGTVLYLNEDYLGGEIYYPQYGIEVKPRAGCLIMHRGSSDQMHGIKEITSGTRYSVPAFWGDEEKYNNEF
jgi:hypothetical protein